jgi:hypothetical protein
LEDWKIGSIWVHFFGQPWPEARCARHTQRTMVEIARMNTS